MSKQDTEPVENVMNEEEEEDVEQLTEEQKRQMEMEQEAKLKQTHGAEALQNTKHSYLIKKDRKKFDSADYAMKKNSGENKGEPVPKAIKKGEIAKRFGSHLAEQK
ncbi:hypothetical protein FDP41_001354 [Naegleria fowleri]|uniref:Uncharacterized protein n=1 Tax=Naegleria fowleri TaxID=5763 RepID=A0A6A5BWI9_NAEFO|nr:uncharacterized protein FDP41_001354 [Naegleria fowleri]KAF0979686.1 hypothetical protein FDP41_001354 [Naegleria fowleri]CAG4711176.1 unnamed protein product [Naegleria fowleri]